MNEDRIPADANDLAATVPPDKVTSLEDSSESDITEQLSLKDQPAALELSPSTRPVEYYPFSGKPCEGRYCGIEGVDGPMECATYETTAGQEVYGCANPKTFERKGCYEITFYTKASKPYSNMDTCSGEEAYGPPEPPEGAFQYWEPPDEPQDIVPDLYGYVVEYCQVSGPVSRRDPYCGLKGSVPKNYECNVYYDTANGTVRGCAPARLLNDYYHEYSDSCAEEGLHLYDEVGRDIGTANLCPKITMEECNTALCGQSVPSDWVCRREEHNLGDLYRKERRTYIRCAAPLLEDFINGYVKERECKGEPLGVLFDEQDQQIWAATIQCIIGGGGGGDMAEWAGFDADDADDALDGNRGHGDAADDGSPGGIVNAPPTAVMRAGGAASSAQLGPEDSIDTALVKPSQRNERSVLTILYTLLAGNVGNLADMAATAHAPEDGSTLVSVQNFTVGSIQSGIADDETGGDGASTKSRESARVQTEVRKNLAGAEASSAEQFDMFGSEFETMKSDGAASSEERAVSQPGRNAEGALQSALVIRIADDGARGHSTTIADGTVGKGRRIRNAAFGWAGAVGDVPDAALHDVADDGLFGVSKAIIALVVLCTSGGILGVYRRYLR